MIRQMPAFALAPSYALILGAHSAAAQTTPLLPPQTSLSPYGMFLAADIVVQGVMVGLLLASVAVWAIWAGKLVQIGLSRRGLRRGMALIGAPLPPRAPRLIRAMVDAVEGERSASKGLAPAGIRDRAASELDAITAAAQRRLQSGLAVIGTVAATAPFIGLFGTVWGIMNSFIGIAETEQTNLAVVAPGIAEALLATGIGLVAAIPAVILYNHLTRLLASHRAALAEAARRVNVVLSRDLDRAAAGLATPDLHLAAE